MTIHIQSGSPEFGFFREFIYQPPVVSQKARPGFDPAFVISAERHYSGRILVRIPPELHRRLSMEAAEQHVSLNRLISNRLADPDE